MEICTQGGTSVDGNKKWLPKPLAWFRWEEDATNEHTKGSLQPLAIQLDASSDPVDYTRKKSRIHTPNEKNKLDWLFAKICVQVRAVKRLFVVHLQLGFVLAVKHALLPVLLPMHLARFEFLCSHAQVRASSTLLRCKLCFAFRCCCQKKELSSVVLPSVFLLCLSMRPPKERAASSGHHSQKSKSSPT
jgi:hypothetical protein